MEDTENKQGQVISPGHRLRQARERSGLSVKEVATHLKLSHEKIEALERGKVDQLSAPVFVAGYLRAYAKLVGLPEEEIINDFKGLAEMEAPSIDPSASPAANNYGQMETSSIIKWVKKNDWSKQIIWGSVITVLAVILFVFFVDDGISIRALTENAPAQKETKVSTVKIEEIKAEEKDNISNINEIEKTGDVDKVDTIEEIKKNSKNEVRVTPAKETIIPKLPESSVDKVSVKEVQRPKSENLHHSVLVLNFKADSWVEINDALDKRLLYRLGKAGTSKTIWGVAPFKIQLGYVGGVEIIFNGKPYDLSRFANRKSVRFNLGKESGSVN